MTRRAFFNRLMQVGAAAFMGGIGLARLLAVRPLAFRAITAFALRCSGGRFAPSSREPNTENRIPKTEYRGAVWAEGLGRYPGKVTPLADVETQAKWSG